ncbi:hypothetical protein [Rhizobium laguerreae]|uniref:hypothetical protein n=1 Tax=Rhizobium laguerreae TaxID=1076926 RepID=UPI001C90932B|nr:hypothetical protein [Rhizobium laguerreae]MBY3169367.1 hypothetical protein [Rhizobium laguerreae]MBY3190521.1 hypothetical protein [Rhizobium laguerreae]
MLKPEATLRRRQVKTSCNIKVVADQSADRLGHANLMPAPNPKILIRQRQCRRLHGYFLGVAILFSAIACLFGPRRRFFAQCRNRLELA